MKLTLSSRLLASLLLAANLAGCAAPLVLGGAAVGGMMAVDRRTAGTQVEDEGIELRSTNRIFGDHGDKVHINVTSYNRQVLLTGEVPSEQVREAVQKTVSQVANVRSIVNELAVMPITPITQRSNDTFITGKMRASLLDAKDLTASAFKVVTERGVIYLMGIVSQRPFDQAGRVPALAAHGLHVGVELVHQRRDGQRAPLRRASSSTRPRSLRIQSTAKPKSNLPVTMVLPRLSICQLCAAPLPITSSTCFMSSPARWPKAMASDRPCTRPAMQIWLTILASWPAPASPMQREGARKGHGHRLHGRIERRRVAAAHHGELAVLRAGLAAGHRRVDKLQAQRRGPRVQLARHIGRGGGVVHEDGARLHAGKGAVGAQHHRAQVVVVADAAEHDVGAGCASRGVACGASAAVFCAPGF
jgi:osmotically-inducible protein OsmY